MNITLEELARQTSAAFFGNPNFIVRGVNTLEAATEHDLSFLANPRYIQAMRQSCAGVICVDPSIPLIEGKNFLIAENPSRVFQQIVEILFSRGSSGFSGIHPTAVIHETASVGKNVQIGPYSVIDRDVKIGEGTILGPHVSIGYETEVGSHCFLHASVVVRERCFLGDRVILQPGAVIGSCGFGFTTNAAGFHQKLEQLGIVVIEDDVEIGANTTIDRARFKETRIGKGSKIDNLCQVAHNVEIGKHNMIAAQTGIAGSSKTGSYVVLGGQVGVAGHVELEDCVMVAGRGGVSKSLKKGKYRGSPALPLGEYQRHEVYIRKIEHYFERIKILEKKIEEL